MDIEELKGAALSRRSALKKGAATAFLLSQAALLEQLALAPARAAAAATAFSDIQFDLGAFIKPAQIFNDGAGNVTAQFGPVFTLLLPARLSRTPTRSDQATLAAALNAIEASYLPPILPACQYLRQTRTRFWGWLAASTGYPQARLRQAAAAVMEL